MYELPLTLNISDNKISILIDLFIFHGFRYSCLSDSIIKLFFSNLSFDI